MTDSMKFGPEWLRNLSQDGTPGSSGGGPRYQLAEHRYGREEMLALFDRNLGPPELLGRFKSLYVERLQPPLALAPTAEEEVRVWQPRPMPGMGGNRGGGRGGSVDRGRGRGRGSYHPVAYQRSQSGYDEDVGLRINTRAERPWSDRNGDTEWNGATSPRKEYNNAGRGSMDNWRRHRAEEDDEGWRTQGGDRRPDKWGRGTSWRDGDTDGAGDRELSRGFDRIERELRERGERGDRGSNRNPTWNQPRKQWEDDILPEWAMENPSESGGTFDASGAFHGSDEEHELSNPKLSHSQSTTSMRQQSPKPTTLSRSQTQGSISIKRNIEEQHRSREDPSSYPEKEKPLEKSTSSVNISIKSRDTSSFNNSTITDKSNFHTANSVPNLLESQSLERDDCSPEKSLPLHKSTPRKIQNSSAIEQLPENEQSIEIARSEPFIDNSETSENKEQKEIDKVIPKLSVSTNVCSFTQVNENKNRDIDPSPPDNHIATDIVTKLMLEEDKSPLVPDTYNQIPNSMSNIGTIQGGGISMVHNQPAPPAGSDKWFYRDPQGEVQGPFLATEMAEWFRAGYFTTVLQVRRACDELFTSLGDLVRMCGGVPFLASNRFPPIKSEPTTPPEFSLRSQYEAHLLQRHLLLRQQQAAILNKLSQTEHWGALSAAEQNSLVVQQMAQSVIPDGLLFQPDVPIPAMVPPVPSHVPPAHVQNPLMQLIAQMQHSKNIPQASMVDNHMKPTTNHLQSNHLNSQSNLPSIPTNLSNMPIPNINHVSIPPVNLMNNIALGNLNNINNKTMPLGQNISNNGMGGVLDHPTKPAMSGNDPIQSLLRQLSSQSKTEGGWNNNWGPNPASMWDLQGPKPEMKTEQQILEEQMKLRQEEEAQKKREVVELQQKREAEEAKIREEKLRKQAEIEEKIRLQKEIEDKRKEEQRRQELERKKLEEKEKKAEEKIRKELEKAKKDAEEKRLRELEEKRRQKELRKQEEEKRKEDEAKKKMDDEERKKKEEESRIQEENKRRQMEALKKLQEQQNRAAAAKAAPWRCEVSTAAAAPITGPSLIEIQRLEREKRAEQLKEQQQLKEAREQQAALIKEQELAAATERNAMQLKWANQHPSASKVKSVAEIQAEEQKELAKHAAAERLAAQQRERETVVAQQSVGIWSSAPSLNWTNTAWTSNTGFWDEAPAPVQAKPAVKSTTKVVAAKSPASTNVTNHSLKPSAATKPVVTLKQNNTQKNNIASGKNLNNNNLNKKGKKDDKEDFLTWCTKVMSSINSSVDVQTFVGFLNDLESPFEVKDYIKIYLGETKEATEFSKQFLERRSRFKNQQRAAQAHMDDMCSPAPAVNPSSEFQEGKSKKTKKSKMQKIDARILGFNVTAAQDRINIGERDFGDATNN